MMNHYLNRVLIGVFLHVAGCLFLSADNWPEWRGPVGDGLVKDAGYPLAWSPDRNVLWETELPAPGNSSPVLWNDRIFVTCSNPDGTERSLLAFDRTSGQLLWKETIFHHEDDPTHATNPWCAATPATDGEAIYVWNGSAGATAYDFAGKQLWHRDLGNFVHQWGHASSPRLFGDWVIYFGSPGPRVLLTALHKKTGETIWERSLDRIASPPQELHGSFATPFLWKNGNRDELLLPLPGYLASFDPHTGDEWWRCDGLGNLAYADALVGEDVILAFSGFRGPAMGMRQPKPDETGNLTSTHRLWKNDTVLQRVGSGVIAKGLFYLCGRKGELHCGDIYNGEIVWTHDLRRQAWSAISLMDNKLFLTDQLSTTYIFEPTEQFVLLEQNSMQPKERTNSTLVFSDQQLFLRTYDRLYAIQSR